MANEHGSFGAADIPLKAAVAGVRVGLTADGFIVNPTVQQMAHSRLDLVMAGTEDKLLMVEGFCDFLTDAQMQEVGCYPSCIIQAAGDVTGIQYVLRAQAAG